MNFSNILKQFQQAFIDEDPNAICNFMNINGDSYLTKYLKQNVSDWEDILRNSTQEIKDDLMAKFTEKKELDNFIEFVTNTIQSFMYYFIQREYSHALEYSLKAFESFGGIFRCLTKYTEMWLFPVLDKLCINIKKIAKLANSQEIKKGHYEDHFDQVLYHLKQYKSKIQALKAADTSYKFRLLVILTNSMSWIYSKSNQNDKYTEMKNGNKTIYELAQTAKDEGLQDIWGFLSKKETIMLQYYQSKLSLMEGKILNTSDNALRALRKCPKSSYKNIKLILKLLCVSKLLEGKKLPKDILKNYDLDIYFHIEKAIVKGSLKDFNIQITKISNSWIKSGLYLSIDDLRELVYRNLAKKVYKIENTYEISLNKLVKAFNYSSRISPIEEDYYTNEEIEFLIGNLIAQGFINGYIDYIEDIETNNKEVVLILNKQKPFPKIFEVRQKNRR